MPDPVYGDMAPPVMHVFRNDADKLSHETGRIRSRVRPAVQGCIKDWLYLAFFFLAAALSVLAAALDALAGLPQTLWH